MTEYAKFFLTDNYFIPDYGFKIPKDVFDCLYEGIYDILKKEALEKISQWALQINISFSLVDKENSMVKGPSRNNAEKIVSFGIHLPSEKISKSQNQLSTFIEYFFDGLRVLPCVKI